MTNTGRSAGNMLLRLSPEVQRGILKTVLPPAGRVFNTSAGESLGVAEGWPSVPIYHGLIIHSICAVLSIHRRAVISRDADPPDVTML